MSNQDSAQRDLAHFLRLAHAQLRNRIQTASIAAQFTPSQNRMRMLEELIKEQVPNEDSRSSARATR